MEYRGYDSAGIVTLNDAQFTLLRATGKVVMLQQCVVKCAKPDVTGIGHTRWATHGEPSVANAHPHVAGAIALVHNGIIENYQELKDDLSKKGVQFASQTDSEVLAQLINYSYKNNKNVVKSVQNALKRVRGTFGIVVACKDDPAKLIAARRGSPLQIGLGLDGTHIASDTAALVGHARDVVYLKDDQLAICTADNMELFDLDMNAQQITKEQIKMELEAIKKQGYDHFLLKEIMEQPQTVKAVLSGRLDHKLGTSHLGGLNISDDKIRKLERIIIIGCGTAYYAGVLGKYLIERLTGIPVDVEVASEYRYRDPIIGEHSVALFISQSGETADTLACVDLLKRRKVPTLGLVNVVGSTIARAVDGGIFLHAGPEISVASTKAFTNQVIAELLFALHVARTRGLSLREGRKIVTALEQLPTEIENALKIDPQVKKIAQNLKDFKNAIYLGRNTMYPIALEGALKLKEVSYIHAEAFPAGEVKHGPIALVDKNMLVAFAITDGPLAEKTQSNLQEIKARGGTVLAVTDFDMPGANYTLKVATSSLYTAPLVMNVAFQLLAYYVAVQCGRDVDKPRNLAKSVTVE